MLFVLPVVLVIAIPLLIIIYILLAGVNDGSESERWMLLKQKLMKNYPDRHSSLVKVDRRIGISTKYLDKSILMSCFQDPFELRQQTLAYWVEQRSRGFLFTHISEKNWQASGSLAPSPTATI